MENLLDWIGYHDKWHGTVQNSRVPYTYSPNEHLIEEIFRRLGIREGTCVEFGAWDGVCNSNTKRLIDRGWHSIQIEADTSKFQQLQETYRSNKRVRCINRTVDTQNNLFDDITGHDLGQFGRKGHIDFCSIDIDGHDVEVFETFTRNLPTVVCIEGGQMLYPFHPPVPSHIAQNNVQQSLATMHNIFARKGYRLLCTYQDSFFIKEEFYYLFDVSSNLMNLYLDGLEAFPKIPWIHKKLEEVGISNEILEAIIAKVTRSIFDFVKLKGTKAHKMIWVDQNYDIILEALQHYRQAEGV